jgi:sulfite reductase (NADPH) hemoprotein beta-component
MYRYDHYDQAMIDQRVAQFRDQTRRFLAGELSEDEFRVLRLQNGLYIQRHAPMLRIAIPYGLLSAVQLRQLAHVTRNYDRGYGHFTTRHNLQLHWPQLERVPDILQELAKVQLHAIQTSGNCVRNVSTDQFAGVAADEIVDPRPFCEIIRQWSTFNPEFAYLPRKFKIAVCGAGEDRVATLIHDVGLYARRADDGEIGFRVVVGGGLGRTPMIGAVIRDFLPWRHVLTYLEAILRLYNRYGRRDNKWKARIKFLVKDLGPAAFAAAVEEEWTLLRDTPATLTDAELRRVAAHFEAPAYLQRADETRALQRSAQVDPAFGRWLKRNVHAHKVSGYAIVTLSLKAPRTVPGDVTAAQMEAVADLADRYSFGELRVSHEQNLILADVPQAELFEVWQAARRAGLATPTVGLITDIVCCPGGDYCSLANAKSIPVAEAIRRRFEDLDYVFDLGDLDLNISGCMNACGHHHLGHIGILGVDKSGAEFYQITIGGRQGAAAELGKVIGPSLPQAEVASAIERLIEVYVENRHADERFVDTVARLGIDPFKEHVYANRESNHSRSPDRQRSLVAA